MNNNLNEWLKMEIKNPDVRKALMEYARHKDKPKTNKDLMEEIHRSKLSFCSYIEEKHSKYDFIVADVREITQERIDIERTKKLTEMQAAEKKARNLRNNKEFKSSLTIDDVPPDSIVVRVMTYEHIPLNPEKEGKAKTTKDSHARCNFPPFQHYIVRDDEVICVLKSHWQGGLENGHVGDLGNILIKNGICNDTIETNKFIIDEIVNIVYDPNTTGKGQVLSIANGILNVQHVSGTYKQNNGYIYGTESNSNTTFTTAVTAADNIPDDEEIYWTAVTYYDFETFKNEYNKTIRVLDNRYGGIAVRDLKNLMSNK